MSDDQSLEERVATLERRVEELHERVASDSTATESEHPASAIAGIWKDHPDLDDFKDDMRKYREQVDAKPERQCSSSTPTT